MIDLIRQHHSELMDLCRKYGVSRLNLFGSAAKGDFDPGRSDLDFTVDFRDLKVEDAADRYLGLLVDLEDLFGVKVDLVSYGAIRNPHFKHVVDASQVSLYAA